MRRAVRNSGGIQAGFSCIALGPISVRHRRRFDGPAKALLEQTLDPRRLFLVERRCQRLQIRQPAFMEAELVRGLEDFLEVDGHFSAYSVHPALYSRRRNGSASGAFGALSASASH